MHVKYYLYVVATLLLSIGCSRDAEQYRQPNIIIVVAPSVDSGGVDDDVAPTISAFARESFSTTGAVSIYSQLSSSVPMLLSGGYSHYGALGGGGEYLDVMRHHKYRCAYFGCRDWIERGALYDYFDVVGSGDVGALTKYIDQSQDEPIFAIIVLDDSVLAIEDVDTSLDIILQCVDNESIAHDAIVVFTASKGADSSGVEQVQTAFNVPFMLRYPARVAPSRRNVVLDTSDIMPTIMALSVEGSAVPPIANSDDLSRVVLGARHQSKESMYALSVCDGSGVSQQVRAVRYNDYSMVVAVDGDMQLSSLHIYNDVMDPYHMSPLSEADILEVANKLYWSLASALERTGDTWYRERIIGDVIPYSD